MFFYLSTVFTDSYIKNLRLTFPHHSAIVIVKQRANARNRTRFPDSPHHREPSAGVRRYAISETILCEQCTEPSRCHRDSPVTGKLIAAGLRPQRWDWEVVFYDKQSGNAEAYAFVFDCTFVQQDEGVFVLQKCHPSLCPMLIYQKGAAFGREKKWMV